MDNVRLGEAPCSKSVPDAGYLLQIPDCAEPEKVSILCPLWDLARSCGVQARVDGVPCQDHGNSEFGGPKGVKQLRAMLGHRSYYRKFIKAYA